jgi:nitroreductase
MLKYPVKIGPGMKFEKPVAELVSARKSVRTYTGGPIEPATMEKLLGACRELDRGVFGEPARFSVVEKPFARDQPVKLGDYGLQKNPRYFFLGAIRKGDHSRESWGYLLEHLVLKATGLRLGTCWMGLFNREFFADYKTAPEEHIPTIAVVGVPAEKPRLGERFIRLGIGANGRRDWKELFFSDSAGRPLTKEEAGQYAGALEMVRWAPSSGNTQPWRIVMERDRRAFHFFLKKAKQAYYDAGMHHVDIGIAMAHFELAMREKGIGGKWTVLDPKLPSAIAGTEYRVSWVGK